MIQDFTLKLNQRESNCQITTTVWDKLTVNISENSNSPHTEWLQEWFAYWHKVFKIRFFCQNFSTFEILTFVLSVALQYFAVCDRICFAVLWRQADSRDKLSELSYYLKWSDYLWKTPIVVVNKIRQVNYIYKNK